MYVPQRGGVGKGFGGVGSREGEWWEREGRGRGGREGEGWREGWREGWEGTGAVAGGGQWRHMSTTVDPSSPCVAVCFDVEEEMVFAGHHSGRVGVYAVPPVER